jgi:hypothetical protein
MRLCIPIFTVILSLPLTAQEPAITPTEELRANIREWVETMQAIQQEENEWSRDQEVLQNYKEGLEREIADLKQQIADATTRKEGADSESLEQSAERDRLAAAKDELTAVVRRLEESLSERLSVFPAPLLAEPKVAQGVEDLKAALALPEDKRNEGVSKRLMNVINLLTEAEKFQQTVHLRPELHKNADGREFNMQVIYFGLACAYAVNEDGSFALAGQPTAEGWKFEERKDLASDIQRLIATTTGDADAAFVNLPISKP